MEGSLAQGMTRKEVAAKWGVSRQRIDTLVNSGELVEGKDGLIDEAHADQVRAGQDPNRIEKEAVLKEVGGQANPQQKSNHPLVQARTMETVYRARYMKTRSERAEGKLVERDAVKAEGFEIGVFCKQACMALPARLAPELAVLMSLPAGEVQRAIHAVLDREMRRFLQDLSEGLKQIPSSKGEAA